MSAIPVIEAVLNTASAFVGVTEQGGPNDGQCVRLFQKVTGNKPPDPWCMSFVHFVGSAALGKEWPVLKSASCQAVGSWAKPNNILFDKPEIGDIFLLWYETQTPARFAHTGYVIEVLAGGKIRTIEGNTNDDGSREGFKVCIKTRSVKSKDRFVRWEKLVR